MIFFILNPHPSFEKGHIPPLSQQPPLKIEILSTPPPSLFGRRFNRCPPPPSETGLLVYTMAPNYIPNGKIFLFWPRLLPKTHAKNAVFYSNIFHNICSALDILSIFRYLNARYFVIYLFLFWLVLFKFWHNCINFIIECLFLC